MRLLLATDHYLPHPGGSSRVILETSRRLRARGHAVTVLTFERDPTLPERGQIEGVPVVRIPLRGRLSTYPRAFLAGRRALAEHLTHQEYDVLHIHLPLIGLGAVTSSHGRRVPRVYTFYGPWHQEMRVELYGKRLAALAAVPYRGYVALLCQGLKRWQGFVMRRCQRVVVLSEHSRHEIAAFFPAVDGDRVLLIPGGVDVERFRPAPSRLAVRARLGLPEHAPILLTVRRLVPRMGLENLLSAFAQLSRERDDLYLVIGGRGRSEGELRALAGQLGVAGRVRFAGFIAEVDLPAYYQAADLFVLPTLALEGFGLITLEALACGLPVVGTPVGSTCELLGQFDARFLTGGTDPQSLGEGIARGLALVEGEGPALAERCRAFALPYDWERIVDRYEMLYTELLNEQTSGL